MPVEVNAGIDYLQKVFGAVVAHPKGIDPVGVTEEIAQQLSRERGCESSVDQAQTAGIALGIDYLINNGILDRSEAGIITLNPVTRAAWIDTVSLYPLWAKMTRHNYEPL